MADGLRDSPYRMASMHQVLVQQTEGYKLHQISPQVYDWSAQMWSSNYNIDEKG